MYMEKQNKPKIIFKFKHPFNILKSSKSKTLIPSQSSTPLKRSKRALSAFNKRESIRENNLRMVKKIKDYEKKVKRGPMTEKRKKQNLENTKYVKKSRNWKKGRASVLCKTFVKFKRIKKLYKRKKCLRHFRWRLSRYKRNKRKQKPRFKFRSSFIKFKRPTRKYVRRCFKQRYLADFYAYLRTIRYKLTVAKSKLRAAESKPKKLIRLAKYKGIVESLNKLFKHYESQERLLCQIPKLKVNKYQKFKKSRKNKVIPNNKPGKLRVLFTRRNIFLTLTNHKGILKTSISSGFMKVKGRKRHSLHIVKATGQLIVSAIFKHKLINLVYESLGKTFNRKKKTIRQVFSRIEKFRFIRAHKPAPRSHNGCRPKKIRRK